MTHKMYVKNLKLENFRNYENLDIKFNKNFNILVGENGAGKTNILEALYYSATTHSPRTKKVENLIKSGSQKFKIALELFKNDLIEGFEYFYSIDKEKELKNNAKILKQIDLFGKILFVYFSPEDLLIIKGESILRRRFLDFALFQIYPNYKFDYKNYLDILKKRNFVLKEIKFNRQSKNILIELDEIFIKSAYKIYQKRKDLIDFFNLNLSKNFCKIYFKNDSLALQYKPFFNKNNLINIENFSEQNYLELLQNSFDRDVKLGFTFFSPHRDDLIFNLNDKDVKFFASQGQQRLYLLTLKIIISDIMFYFLKEKPILIFDDVFSELDYGKMELLINFLNKKQQVFLSTVDFEKAKILFNQLNLDYSVFEIKNGRIIA